MNLSDVNPNFEMLLTSVGPTTESMQQRLHELGRHAAKMSALNILVITDGWSSYQSNDGVSVLGQLKHKAESKATQLWTEKYLRYVLGAARIQTESLGRLEDSSATEIIMASDMLIVPGGNTYLAMRGLRRHQSTIRRHVAEGKPYIGNSAGSIVAGWSVHPAGIEPADTFPLAEEMQNKKALGLLNFDIAPHAAGRKKEFDMPGYLAKVASSVCTTLETPPAAMERFIIQRNTQDVHVETLDDQEGLSVSRGLIKKI